MQNDAGGKYTYDRRVEFPIAMNIKSLAGTVIEIIIKIAILAVLVMFIFKWVTKAYDFGYKVFADEPVSANNGRTITVSVPEGATVENVADMLQEKGLIEDSQLFKIQELLSAYHGMIKPGMYDLSTGMTAAEMLKIMSSEPEEPEDGPNSQNIQETVSDESAQEVLNEDMPLADTPNGDMPQDDVVNGDMQGEIVE